MKHLDDAGWILATEGATKAKANVDAFAVLSLEQRFLSLVYSVNCDVKEGKYLA